jgi:hypothetical protein
LAILATRRTATEKTYSMAVGPTRRLPKKPD